MRAHTVCRWAPGSHHASDVGPCFEFARRSFRHAARRRSGHERATSWKTRRGRCDRSTGNLYCGACRTHEDGHRERARGPGHCRGRRAGRGQRTGRPVGSAGRGARGRQHDAGRAVRLPGRQHHRGRRREHRLVPAGEDRRLRRDRYRARATREADGRDQPGAAVEERGDQRRHVQVRRRPAGRGVGRDAAAARGGDRRGHGRRRASRRDRAQQVGARRDPGETNHRCVGRCRSRALLRRALPDDAEGTDAAGDRELLGDRRRAKALSRVRRRESDDVQGLGPGLGHAKGRQGRRPVQSVPGKAVRSRARRGRDSARHEEYRRHLEHDHRLR